MIRKGKKIGLEQSCVPNKGWFAFSRKGFPLVLSNFRAVNIVFLYIFDNHYICFFPPVF